MINHHPSHTILQQFVDGTLPASVAVIVASHVEMCPRCQQLVHQLTELAAANAFDLDIDSATFDTEGKTTDDSEHQLPSGFEEFLADLDNVPHAEDDNIADEADNMIGQTANAVVDSNNNATSIEATMLDQITRLPVEKAVTLPKTITEIEVSGQRIALPNAIKSLALKEWQGLGKISRARINLDDETRRTSLLHIDKGGSVPHHTHKGFEITLLLQGSFEDEMGTYHAGDFIWLSGEHTHNPVTQEGCVCLTVSSDALHFTQGVSQLFNPLGKLIY